MEKQPISFGKDLQDVDELAGLDYLAVKVIV